VRAFLLLPHKEKQSWIGTSAMVKQCQTSIVALDTQLNQKLKANLASVSDLNLESFFSGFCSMHTRWFSHSARTKKARKQIKSFPDDARVMPNHFVVNANSRSAMKFEETI
jgi:hypothetical protein